jgi:hypothetical protein
VGIDLEGLLQLETAVWWSLVNGDPRADEALLTDDFLGIYPTGFAGRTDHVGQLSAGPTVASFEISDARMLTVDEDAALLAYRASYVRAAEGTEREEMFVSSLWCRRGNEWRNVFSQDTPATGERVV